MLLAEAERRIVVLTEKDMYERCIKEVQGGRVPSSIEFVRAEIPLELEARLQISRGTASDEVLPRRGTKGSHRQFKHPTKPGRVTVSGQLGDDMPKGTLASVKRQAGLKGARQ